MKCQQIKIHLSDYLQDRLDTKLKAKILAHLNDCHDCSRELDFLSSYFPKLSESLAQTPPVPAPVDFEKRVRQAIEKSKRPSLREQFFPKPMGSTVKWAGLATGLICILFAVILVNPMGTTHLKGLSSDLPKQANAGGDDQEEVVKSEAVASKPRIAAKEIKTYAPAVAPAKNDTTQYLIAMVIASEQAAPVSKTEVVMNKVAMERSLEESGEVSVVSEEAEGKPADSVKASPAPEWKAKLLELVKSLGGQVLGEEEQPQTNPLQQLVVKLPTQNWPKLLTGLSGLGQTTAPNMAPAGAGEITVTIQFRFLP